eukprot:Gb_33595 [translate_table: standard]
MEAAREAERPFDLKIKVEKPFFVRPAQQESEGRSFFLSNFDQNLVFTVETLHFFGANPGKPWEDVAEKIAGALSKLLVTYDYMAGRLKLNSEQGRLEIDCNGAGAMFAAASSELAVAQLPDITYPNPAFAQLILQEYGVEKLQDLPLLFLQVTRFKCGGFAIGLGTNHTLMDGFAAVDFMKNLASVAKGEGLAVIPRTDRSCLKARSPLRIEYEHLEFTRFSNIPHESEAGSAFTATAVGEVCDVKSAAAAPKPSFKLFSITGEMLNRLKHKATEDGRVQQCTGFEAVTALLWQAHATALETNLHKTSTVLFAVDVRPRMTPPLPKEFSGNAVFPGYARATVEELRECPLSLCVQKVQEGIARVTDEYVRSAIDWLEVYKGVPCADRSIVVSPWKRLGFDEVEYPWGKPLYSGPVIDSWMDFVLLLPNNKKQEGLNVFMALEDHVMENFRCMIESC